MRKLFHCICEKKEKSKEKFSRSDDPPSSMIIIKTRTKSLKKIFKRANQRAKQEKKNNNGLIEKSRYGKYITFIEEIINK